MKMETVLSAFEGDAQDLDVFGMSEYDWCVVILIIRTQQNQ